jgi:hypothetical protein
MVARMQLLIPVLAVCETIWALLCAYTGADLAIFYGVLVAASAVFFIPALTDKGSC